MTELRRLTYGIVLSACFGLLSACDATLVNPEVPPPGSSPAFSDGWVDGCLSGFADAGREFYEHSAHKDEARFATDPEYHAGFQKAYAACFAEQQREPRMVPAF